MSRQSVGPSLFMVFAAMLSVSCSLTPRTSPFHFLPLTQSAVPGSMSTCAPLVLPEGITQSILVQEQPVCSQAMHTLDVVTGTSDWTDMSTVNETGMHSGRYFYRTHETKEGRGAMSVLDVETGQTSIHTGEEFGGWDRLDGIEWTPWGTILTAEEAGAYGRLFECQVDRLLLTCVDRPAVGRMSHEGIAVTPDGSVYLADEFDGGSIFKFVPDAYGDLSAGQLFALNVHSREVTICSETPGIGVTPTGPAEWVALTPGRDGVVTDPAYNARAAAREAGVAPFCRSEDIEVIDDNVYVSLTTTHAVIQIPWGTPTPEVTEYAGINTNMQSEESMPTYGLYAPDNLASDQDGNLYIAEDNSGRSDIWVAAPDKDGDGTADSIMLFATLTTRGAEATGIYISPFDPATLYVNVQHADNGNDMTLTVSRNHVQQ